MPKPQSATSAPIPFPPQNGDPTLSPHVAKGRHATLIARLIGALVIGSMLGWSLFGGRIVNERPQQVVEVLVISVGGLCAYLISAYSRRRNVDLERAYSTRLEELTQRLRSLAYRDALTGLYNHRYFHDQLSHEVERAQRYGHTISVIMLDLDNFKMVNDSCGHLVGDQILSMVGELIVKQLRGADLAARYGGDEFAIILPETNRQAALAAAKKVTESIRVGGACCIPVGQDLSLGVSSGVATWPEDARTLSHLLQVADRRLYAAKERAAALRGQTAPNLWAERPGA
jgi:diguanylate cyclase (GGDEF)-like protein